MKRNLYKGINTNNTIRKVLNWDKNIFEYKEDRYTCGRARCMLCHPHKYTNRGKVKNKKSNMNYYMDYWSF